MERRLTLMNMMCNQTIDVKFKDISYTVQVGSRGPKKQILNNLSGFFRSAELTGIMGPSGAGKSTLLNILSGFQEGLYTGTVEYLNRYNKNQSNNKHRCYIQQTDNLYGLFTVHETMMMASYLKINRTTSLMSRQNLINDILKTLKIASTKNTQVSNLSGGQKKRLSIALELIGNPPLMFLDEPTTGLDFSATVQCMTVLKTLAKAGRAIICTIHQPSAAIYQMFDHIYLVENGHCMYRSSPENTVDYFARQDLQCPKYHNPADYMLEVVSKEYGNYSEQLIMAAKSFDEHNDEMRSIKSSRDMIQDTLSNNQTLILTNPPTELVRFWILLKRCVILAHRDTSIFYIKLAINIIIGVTLGVFYEHAGSGAERKALSNLRFLFSLVVYVLYTTMIPGVIKFPLEIEILRKERFNNWYQLRTYYMAMLTCTIPIQIILIFIATSISYYISSQPLEFFRYFMFMSILLLVSFISEGMGLGLGVMFVPINGIFVGCISAAFMILFSGIAALFKDMSRFMYYISYLNVMRYAFEGLVQSVYGNHREKLFCPDIYCHLQEPSVILIELDLVEPMFWVDVTVLFGFSVMLYVLTYVALKKRFLKMY